MSPEIVGLLLDGVVASLQLIIVSFLLSRFIRDIVGRSLLAIALLIAAAAYVAFAVGAGEGAWWVVGEFVGVGVYGAMGLLGVRGSPMWLAAGWALHPLWDVVLHYFGPGGSFAPIDYTIPCISFDLLVAVYIAIVYGSGVLGGGRASHRAAVPYRRPKPRRQPRWGPTRTSENVPSTHFGE